MKNAVTNNSIKYFTIMLVVVSFVSCNNNKLKPYKISSNSIVHNNDTISGLTLLKSKCYSCHSISSVSHDEIIAPPLAAVKFRYLRSYSEKDDFVQAVSNWIQDPKQENAIMRGAVNKFKVMPHLIISKIEATTIANFIYNNELEKPTWFQQHFNEEHQNRKGRGNSFRNGNPKKRGKNRI